MIFRFYHNDFARMAGITLATWNHWLDAGSVTLLRWGLDVNIYNTRAELRPDTGLTTGYYTYMEARLLAEYFGLPMPK